MKQVPFLILTGFLLLLSLQAQSKPSSILHFDFPDIQIGTAVNPQGPTGITLFYFPQGAVAAVDIRGGSVGTFFTQEKMHQGQAYIDGVAFAGGGILGMEAIAGTVSSLFAQHNQSAFTKMPLISGAVIFDYTPRQNTIYPDKSLGQQAFHALKSGEFPQGRHGVGVSATAGKLFGDEFQVTGQGGAFKQIGKTKIAVFTVVNAVGVILNEKGEMVIPLKQAKTKQSLQKMAQDSLLKPKQPFSPGAKNTTLTLVVINEKLAPRHLQQLARQVHHALSQVIYPYATILDGDVLYVVSTQSIKSDLYCEGADISADVNAKLFYLGMASGELAQQAVWGSIGYHPK